MKQKLYIKLPVEEIKKRWSDNSESKESFHWPKEEFERMFAEFEKPAADENVIIYDGNVSIKTWMDMNFD